MQQYHVIFEDAEPGAPAPFSFDASGLKEALGRLDAHPASDALQLWCEGKLLGRLERIDADEGSYWRLG